MMKSALAQHHLAQINVGRLRAPLDDPGMAGFVAQFEPINALGDASPGFVWRLQSEPGSTTALSEDPSMIVFMSVWESVDALKNFTYQSAHLEAFRNRAQWFEKMSEPNYCLWWIPAGHGPTIAEGRQKLEHYRAYGPTAEAFSFSNSKA